MCNYCGCRAIEPIARLTAEHVEILGLAHEVGRALTRGDRVAATQSLARLRAVLTVHDAVEELAVYPAMARQPEFADSVGTLFDEHDDLDEVLAAALAVDDSDTHDWSRVGPALETLVEHIDHEEHGLFPAAAVCLDPADWERATAVRADHLAAREP